VQELRGKVEEQGYQVQQLQDHQKKLYIDLDKRLREGGAVKQLSSATNAGTGAPRDEQVIVTDEPDTPAAVPVTASNEPMESEEKLYQKAYQLIQSKDYDNGIKAFQTLIANYPQGKYIPNANYWLGEVYLIKGNLQLAQTAFTNVYRNHPQHPKAGDCLLKLGYIEYSKGHFQQAEELLIKVKNQFPGSTSAQLADARLHKMRLEGSSVQ
jgi:tol-pal system protein YbgF